MAPTREQLAAQTFSRRRIPATLGDESANPGYNVFANDGSSGGVLEQSTGAPSWVFHAALIAIGVGMLVRVLEPAAHSARRIYQGTERRRGE